MRLTLYILPLATLLTLSALTSALPTDAYASPPVILVPETDGCDVWRFCAPPKGEPFVGILTDLGDVARLTVEMVELRVLVAQHEAALQECAEVGSEYLGELLELCSSDLQDCREASPEVIVETEVPWWVWVGVGVLTTGSFVLGAWAGGGL